MSIEKIIRRITLLAISLSVGSISNIEILNVQNNPVQINFEFLDDDSAYVYDESDTNNIKTSIENRSYDLKFFVEMPDEINDLLSQRPSANSSNDISNIQNELYELRHSIKEINLEACTSVLSKLSTKIDIDESSINPYSSTIKFQLDKEELTSELIADVSKMSKSTQEIEQIYITETIGDENFDEIDDAMDVINVKDMVNSSLYTGKNINVGIAEAGGIIRPNSFPNDYSGRNITLNGASTASDHADQVAMIAAGNNGIANESNIFSTNATPYNNDYMNWLIDNNVNIVNTSFGDKTPSIGGTYTSVAMEMDRIIKNSFITVVGSAGNHDVNYPSDRITSPKTAFNYITVGATNEYSPETTSAGYSCYEEQEGYYVSKPNLMAPGAVMTNAYINNPKYSEYNKPKGTSFASPQVVGCIALLMEEFPYLVAYPELVTSIVTSSASPMSSTYNNEFGDNHYDASGLHNQIGSGLLNYEKMREAARQYLSITVPKSKSSYTGSLDQYLEFRVPNNKRIRASLAWLANGTEENNFTDYDLYLTRVEPDGTENNVMRVYGSGNNVEFLDYAVETGGLFRLRIWKSGQSNQNDFLGLSYVIIDDNGGSTSGATEYDVPTLGKVEFKTADYSSFGNVYNNTAIEKTITASSGERIDTKRLRAAIVDNHLVLSAKNKDAGLAYLEYYFDDYINTIEYDFGLWSDNESLIKNSFISLQCYQGNGYWYNVKEFKAKEMGQDKDSLLHYETDFSILTTGFRFVVQTNMVENDNNRGRVVIGDITVS